MQNTNESNIVVLKNEKKHFDDVCGQGDSNVTIFSKQLFAFRNCRIVDVETGEVTLCDIIVKNDLIEKIIPHSDAENRKKYSKCEGVDCKYGLVIPPFYNAFYDSIKAFEKSFEVEVDENMKPLVQDLMALKCSLTGVVYVNDISKGQGILLEGIAEKSEQELNEVCDNAASGKERLCMKVGQDLEELGALDKMYGKPLSQTLEDFGFLDRKDPIVVGGNRFEKDDLQLFRNYDVSFVICPYEDGKFGRRPTNLISLKNLNFDVGIGSGYCFEVDFFGMMRQILHAQRGLFEDESCITEKDVLQMALAGTFRSSDVCTIPEIVNLQEKSMASFIVVQDVGFAMKNVFQSDLYADIFKALVWGKTSDDVLMTVGNGQILQREGFCESIATGLTYEELAIKIVDEMKLKEKRK